MLHGLLWLGLDEELASEANLLLVVDGHLEEHAHVVQLPLDVSVEDGLVAFTPSPEHGEREIEGEGERERERERERGREEY